MTSVNDETHMKMIGRRLGERLKGGEVIELIGDVGAGKTTLVKGIGEGLMVDDEVQSPSFTISRVYVCRNDLELHHYDFYRLDDAGVMQYELAESIQDPKAITVVEWADTVQDVLPESRLTVRLMYSPDGKGRQLELQLPETLAYLKGVV